MQRLLISVLVRILLDTIFSSPCCAMPQPPVRAVTFHEGKGVYYSGTLSLSAHEDTVKLKALGFRHFDFDSRTFGSLKYHAQWPQAAVALPLPDYLNGMDYDVGDPPSEDNEAAERYFDPDGEMISRGPTPYDNRPRMGREMDAASRTLLERMSMQIHNLPRPANGKPDTVIDGRDYVYGRVYMRYLSDSLDLIPFGFKGFDPHPDDEMQFDNTHVNGLIVSIFGYHAYWPINVDVKSLPESMYRMEAARSRRGTGEVITKRKYFDK